jgi:WS/DGAT/MGAT family acyltransferase
MIQRVHHALVDGVSGVDVATALLDATPDVPPVEASTWVAGPQPAPDELVRDAVATAVTLPFRAAEGALAALRDPARLVRAGAELAGAFAALVDDGLLAPHCSLNAPVGTTRRLRWIRTDLGRLKAVSRASGTTVNDVVLAAVAGGVRALLLGRGEVVGAGDTAKVLVPVSLRDAAHRGALGNRVGALLLGLPIGIGDPEARLRAVGAETARLKARGEATTTDVLLGAADLLPTPWARSIARTVETQRFVNLVVTNVPGPPVPLYAQGARMLEAVPLMPLGGNLTLGVAILSYDGALTIGITADGERCADVDVFVDGLEDAFRRLDALDDELGEAV